LGGQEKDHPARAGAPSFRPEAGEGRGRRAGVSSAQTLQLKAAGLTKMPPSHKRGVRGGLTPRTQTRVGRLFWWQKTVDEGPEPWDEMVGKKEKSSTNRPRSQKGGDPKAGQAEVTRPRCSEHRREGDRAASHGMQNQRLQGKTEYLWTEERNRKIKRARRNFKSYNQGKP